MSNPHVDGRTEGAAGQKLSPRQIAALIKLARQAHSKLSFTGEIEETVSFDHWRHRVTMQVVERIGFSVCHNEDYLPLKAYFLACLDREDEAAALRERAEVEPRTWAMKGLQDACAAAADVMPRAMDYATGFLRNQGVDMDAATDKQIWRAMYCVQRKAALLRSAAKAAGATAGNLAEHP